MRSEKTTDTLPTAEGNLNLTELSTYIQSQKRKVAVETNQSKHRHPKERDNVISPKEEGRRGHHDEKYELKPS